MDFWISEYLLLGHTVVNTFFFYGPSMVPGEFQTANRNLIPETKSKLVEKGYVQRKNKTRQWYISWRVSHRVSEAWMRFSNPPWDYPIDDVTPFLWLQTWSTTGLVQIDSGREKATYKMTGHNLKVLYYKMIGKLPQPSSAHIAPAWFLEM